MSCEINRQIDRLMSVARCRMAKADPIMLGLNPTEFDYMTSAERATLHELKLRLPSPGEERAAAIERLRLKRLRLKRLKRKNR